MAVVDGLTKARMLAIEANSVVDGDVNASGNLVLYRHDGTPIDAGHVVGTPGSNGRGIVSAVINGSGRLIITYSDTTSVDVGRVEGLDAAPGSVLVTPDTTIVRTADGRAKFANPTEDDDGATKEYIDGLRSIEIVSGTNLNNLTTPGNYWVSSDPISGLNYPELRAGALEVRQSSALNGILQRFTAYGDHGSRFWTRTHYDSTWQPWKEYVPNNPNYVRIDGVEYQRTGSFGSVAVGTFSGTSPTYYQNISIARPYTPPSGWGFRVFILNTNRVNAVHASSPTITPMMITIMQVYNSTAPTLTLGWELVKI